MRSIIFSACMISIIIISGCSNADNAIDGNDQNLDDLNPARNQAPADTKLNDKLGYVKYSKTELDNDTEKNHKVTVDRTQMADMITRVILRNDAFDQVATLVTDKEVLIAYLKKEDVNSGRTADIAKQSAVAVTPRYLDVYVSENNSLMQDIESLHNSSTLNNDYDNTIDRIITEMEKSPQGINDNAEE